MIDRRLRRNIVANYLGRLWGIASVYLFVPVYLRLLGVDAYGVIAFHTVLVSVLWMADAGLSSALAREVARTSDLRYLRDLLRTVETLYAVVCASVALLVLAAAGWIARRWLEAPPSLDAGRLSACVALMGVATAGQLFANLPIGGLMGLQRQAEANLWTMGYSMVRSGLVVLPLWLVPDLLTYFAWQAVVGVIFALLMRRALWQALALVGHRARVSRLPLQRVYRFALGMFGMSIIAALNTQMDKLVASRLFPIGDFAVYALASLAGQVPSLLTVPIALALLPRLTALAEASDRIALSRLLHVGSGGIAWISAAAAALLCAFPAEVLLVWSGDARIAAQGRLPLMLLSAGGLCLALQLMPYHLALAHGHSRTNLVLGAVVAAVLPFATWALARERGLAGAALPWLVLNLLALAVLGAVLLRRFLPGESCRWWVRDTLLPTVSCFVLAFLIRSFVSDVLPPAVDRSTALMLLSPALMSLPVLALVVLGFARRAAQRIVS